MSTPEATGRVGLLLGALASALALALLGPSLGRLHRHLLGSEYVDHYGTQWFYWFVEHTLREGGELGHTDLFFHPWGKDIFGHTGTNVLDAILALPFRALFGPTLGYNLFVLVGVALTALALGTFLRSRLPGEPLAVGAATLLVATSPFVLFELVEGRPTQAILLLPVLFLHAAWRTAERPGLRWPVAAGLLLALTGYQYWFYALFGGLVALGHGLYCTVRPPAGAGRPAVILGRHVLVAAVAAVAVSPVALPMLQATSEAGTVPGLLAVDLWSMADQTPATAEGTVIGLYTWQPGRLTSGFFARNTAGEEIFLDYVRLLPLPFVLLAGLGLAAARSIRGRLLAAVVLCAGLAVGPTVLLGDVALPNPPYILAVQAVPFLRRLWWPARAMAFVVLLCGVAVAFGLAWLRRRWPRLAPVAVVLAVVGQGLHLRANHMLPFPAWDATVPAGYRCLADGPPGAIIELPYAFTQAHLHYQAAHGRPMLGGMIENNPVFTPEESVDFRQENTWVRRLLGLGSGLRDIREGWEEEDREEARALGYRYVVLQKDAFDTQLESEGLLDNAIKMRRRRLTKKLYEMVGRPVYDDARTSIFAPFGDPSPCAAAPPAPDTEVVGIPDHPWYERTFDSPWAKELRRPIGEARELSEYLDAAGLEPEGDAEERRP